MTAQAAGNQKAKGKGKDGKNPSGSSEKCEAGGQCPVPVLGLAGCLFLLFHIAQGPEPIRQALCRDRQHFSQLQSRQRRIPTSDGRSRARRRRGLIRDMLRRCIECSHRWMQTGCLRLSEASLGRSLRQLASRAAKGACCTSLLEFSGDKRGRLRELLANIVNRIPLSLNYGSLQFSAGPAQWQRPSTCRSVACSFCTDCAARSRLCRVSGRLATKVDRSFFEVTSSHRGAHRAKLFLFNVSMSQWRSVVRRMVRCKLAVALPSDTCCVQLSGGAFAVPKEEARDRLICDRRPQNIQESAVNRMLLPFCPRLRLLILQRSEALGVHIIDTRNCFYLYQVDSSHWHRQVIEPWILASWLHHIDDDTFDDASNADLETWWEPDLRQSSDNDEPHDGHRQIAIVWVMVGDTNAVSVLEMAHRLQLIQRWSAPN